MTNGAINYPFNYVLHLADNALVLGQRNAEWCGHGPVLEEDIALANISLDLVGQSRLLYQYAAELKGDGATEDTLAYFRGPEAYLNYTLLELPHSVTADGERDYAVTIVRNFLYSALMVLLWNALQRSGGAQLAAIAERSLKESRYHLRHSRDWLVRLGDGSAESHARVQAALAHLVPYTAEFWTESTAENATLKQGLGVHLAELRDDWKRLVDDALQEATLIWPKLDGHAGNQLPQGKNGAHSAHLAGLLGEMQSLARQHPGATW